MSVGLLGTKRGKTGGTLRRGRAECHLLLPLDRPRLSTQELLQGPVLNCVCLETRHLALSGIFSCICSPQSHQGPGLSLSLRQGSEAIRAWLRVQGSRLWLDHVSLAVLPWQRRGAWLRLCPTPTPQPAHFLALQPLGAESQRWGQGGGPALP